MSGESEKKKNEENINIADIIKIYSLLSSLFNQKEESKDNKDQQKKSVKKEEKSSSILESFSVIDKRVKIIKSVLPYFEGVAQHYIRLAIKIAEIIMLLQGVSYEQIECWEVKESDLVLSEDVGDWRKGVIKSIKPYADDEQKRVLDIIEKAIDAFDTIENIELMEEQMA